MAKGGLAVAHQAIAARPKRPRHPLCDLPPKMSQAEPSTFANLPDHTKAFYRRAMQALDESRIEFTIGGAYAVNFYAGVDRNTKDLDLFLRPKDSTRALVALSEIGFRVELTHPHWLGKAFDPANGADPDFIDLIFASGSGVGRVDDQWFARSLPSTVLALSAKICPAEDLLWMKAFVLARERFDGADINHLILARGDKFDWSHLLDRFRGHEPVLLAHLCFYRYAYPSERAKVPDEIFEELIVRTRAVPALKERVCYGTRFSWDQYLIDVQEWGFADGRVQPWGVLTQQQVDHWTDAPK